MLNAHSRIGALNDDVKFFRFCYNRYLPLNEENIARMLADEAYRLLNRFNIKLDVKECLETIARHSLSHDVIYKTILLQLFQGRENDIIMDKETLAWSKIPLFLEWFPGSKALLIVRDLRDVVVSFKKLTFAPRFDYLIALFNVMDAMAASIELKQKYPDRFYCVRFEDLKTHPEQTIKKVCIFLEVEFEHQMLDENSWTEYNGEKWINKRHSAFYTEGDHENPMGRWRRLITEEELFLCEWIGRKHMQQFDLKFEDRKIAQKVFDKALEMITSSDLLRECFKKWCETGCGVERYPLDATNPQYWDKKLMFNPSAFPMS
ncbi:MAG: sulfotransferase [Deltaproteobacteria bacterium]|nr:sulfotransferase [Deltaproteobacteria bacterium]